jgi:putative transposase
VKCNVPVAEAIIDEGVLPERVQEALGQLVGAAKEGLLALSVEVGLGVLRELLEAEVDQVVGPRGKWNPERTAVRHGHEDGEVTLGGRRVPVERPRARTADGESEVPLATYEHFASRDALEDVVLERMLAGVSTRQYRRAQEPVGADVETNARSTSKSAVSRTFIGRTRDLLWKLMRRPLADLRLAVMMLDGIELHGRMNIVALGITTEGDKLALGLWDGSTENASVAGALLSDLVDRGLDVEQGLLFAIDGSKALRKAIRQVFGNDVPVQRCVQHYADLPVMPTRYEECLQRRESAAVLVGIIETHQSMLAARGGCDCRQHPGGSAAPREGGNSAFAHMYGARVRSRGICVSEPCRPGRTIQAVVGHRTHRYGCSTRSDYADFTSVDSRTTNRSSNPSRHNREVGIVRPGPPVHSDLAALIALAWRTSSAPQGRSRGRSH